LLKLRKQELENERSNYDERSKEYKELTAEILATQQELDDASSDLTDKEAERLSERLDRAKDFFDQWVALQNQKTDAEIAAIDKEIAASKKKQAFLEKLAIDDNLTAEQSVTAEIKRQEELEAKKEELEKKKFRREIVLRGVGLLQSNIDAGVANPAIATGAQMTALLGLLNGLPAFWGGTETTVENALKVSNGRDGYVARFDGGEKILTVDKSKRTGNMTTEQIAQASEMWLDGMFDTQNILHPIPVDAGGQAFDDGKIVKHLSSLEKTIKEKATLTDFDFDKLTESVKLSIEKDGELYNRHFKLGD